MKRIFVLVQLLSFQQIIECSKSMRSQHEIVKLEMNKLPFEDYYHNIKQTFRDRNERSLTSSRHVSDRHLRWLSVNEPLAFIFDNLHEFTALQPASHVLRFYNQPTNQITLFRPVTKQAKHRITSINYENQSTQNQKQ